MNNILRLIENYQEKEKKISLKYKETSECIAIVLEKCNLFHSIKDGVKPLLWNVDKTFLASYFYQNKYKKNIFISNNRGHLQVRI